MSAILTIALNEFRLWLRSNLALFSLGVFAFLLAASCIISALQISSATQERLELQSLAENTFFAQPNRHPHRMVHYGHYSFRIPPPLSFIDPGIDDVTGQAIFLEGHRQNTAMFANARASANLGKLSSLTPAYVYQIFLPLLIIIIGYASIVRERETRTLENLLAQGVTGTKLFIGKSLALYSIGVILLIPLIILLTLATMNGEQSLASFGLFFIYAAYLFFYCSLTIFVSSVTKKRNFTLGVLVAVWLVSTFIVPRLAVGAADATTNGMGKIESDLVMQRALRDVDDGHNAAAPEYSALLTDLLAKHNVEKTEDLPVNFRGVVATKAEAKLTEQFNRYSDQLMALELSQSADVARFNWFSPFLTLSSASRAISGTDLHHLHRFLRETEKLRFDFVQGLNRVHAEQLRYSDDINRSLDHGAEQRTRVSSENWKTLKPFRFSPDSAFVRWERAMVSSIPLFLWFAAFLFLGIQFARKLEP